MKAIRLNFRSILLGTAVVALATYTLWWSARPSIPAITVSAHGMTHSRPAIDGAVTPDLIPDDVAYSLVLRMLTPDPGPLGERRTRALVRFMYVESIPGSPGLAPPRDEEVDAIMKMVTSYGPRLKAVDPAIRATAQRKEHDFASAGRAAAAKAERAAIVTEFRTQLDAELGPAVASRVHRFVASAKRRMKIIH